MGPWQEARLAWPLVVPAASNLDLTAHRVERVA